MQLLSAYAAGFVGLADAGADRVAGLATAAAVGSGADNAGFAMAAAALVAVRGVAELAAPPETAERTYADIAAADTASAGSAEAILVRTRLRVAMLLP